MKRQITVQNLKCGGCARTIIHQLNALDGVSGVEVDSDHNAVLFEGKDAQIPLVRETLEKLGYPEVGTTEGWNDVSAKARSFVSCAIGKVRGAESFQHSP